MAEASSSSSGVQELISRIRDEGVQAGQAEADQILKDAKAQAARIISEAKAEAAATREKATAEIESEKTAALEGLRLAARDTTLELRSSIISGFERYVKRLVSAQTADEEVVKCIVLVLAGHAVEEFIKDKDLLVRVSDSLFEGGDRSDPKRARHTVLEITSEMLREGIELVPASDVHGGARVQVIGEDLEIDLSDEAVSALILRNLLPRFRAILEGLE